MTPGFLVVTRPPLPEDAAPGVADALGLPPYEARLFLRHPLPSVLKAARDREEAEAFASALRGAGLSVDLLPVEELVSLPPPEWPRRVEARSEGLLLEGPGGRVEAPWDALRLVVLMSVDVRWAAPVGHEFVHHYGSHVVQGRELAEFVLVRDGRATRFRAVPEQLDYSGLGGLKASGAQENWATLIGVVRARSPRLHFDDAMTRTRPRGMLVDGKELGAHFEDAPEDVRRTFELYGEFYLALRTCQALRGELPKSDAPPPPPVPALKATEAPPRAPAEAVEETFRPGATLLPFGLWCGMAVVVGILLLRRLAPEGPERAAALWAAAALVGVGPLAFVAQLARFCWGHVTIVPRAGLRPAGGRIVAWEEIESVEPEGIRLAFDRDLTAALLDFARVIGGRLSSNLLLLGAQVALMAAFALLALAVVIVSGVLAPVLVVLSPWQQRVVVTLRGGGRLVYRDLLGEARFVHRLKAELRRISDAEAPRRD